MTTPRQRRCRCAAAVRVSVPARQEIPSRAAGANPAAARFRGEASAGLSRSASHPTALVLDATGDADPAEALTAILQRPAKNRTAHAVRAHLYEQHGLAVPEDPPLARDEVERLRAHLDRLEAPTAPIRELPGLTL